MILSENQEAQFQHVLFVYGDVMARMERHLQRLLGASGDRLLRDAERFRLVKHRPASEVRTLVERAVDMARAEFQKEDELAIIDAARNAMVVCELRDIYFGNPNLTNPEQRAVLERYPVQYYTVGGQTFSA